MRGPFKLLLVILVAAPMLTACLPSAPNPSDPSGCQYAPLIRSVFVEDPSWAVAIAFRESRCQPDAYNPSGSEGLFQLYHHDDLLAAVCPNFPPSVSWKDPTCNTKAAHLLYLEAGRQPWAL